MLTPAEQKELEQLQGMSSPDVNQEQWQPNQNDLRVDGTQKGKGFLGVLRRPDGRVSSELSIGVKLGGKETEIPSLVPTLDDKEKQYLLNTPEDKIFTANPALYKSIEQKATNHAKKRIAEGKSPFAQEGEQLHPNLTTAEQQELTSLQQMSPVTTPSRVRPKPITTEEYQMELAGKDSGNPYARKLAVEELSKTLPTTAISTVSVGAIKSVGGLARSVNTIGSAVADYMHIPDSYRPEFMNMVANRLAGRGEFWSQVSDEMGASKIQKIAGEVVGSLPVASKIWSPYGTGGLGTVTGVGLAATLGAAEQKKKSGTIGFGGIKEEAKVLGMGTVKGIERFVLGKVLDKLSGIKSPIARRTLGAATLATSAAMRGGKLEEVLTQAALGGILTGYNSRYNKPLSEVKQMAANQKAEALKSGDTVRAERLGQIEQQIGEEITLQKAGGRSDRGQLTGKPTTIKTVKDISGLIGGTKLNTLETVTNPMALQKIGKNIVEQPLAGAKAQELANVAKSATGTIKQKLAQGQQNITNLSERATGITEKTSQVVNEKIKQTSANVANTIDSIRADASVKLGTEIPADPYERSIMFEGKYQPLFEAINATGQKVDVKPVRVAAGIVKGAVEENPINYKYIKDSSVPGGIRVERTNITDMETIIQTGIKDGFTTNQAKQIVSMIPENPTIDIAHAAKSALGRAAVNAKNADASRILNKAKFALENQMNRTAAAAGKSGELQKIDSANNQAKLFDELTTKYNQYTNLDPTTGERILRGEDFAKFLKDNYRDLVNISKLHPNKSQEMVKMGLQTETLKGLSGAKTIEKLTQLGKDNPKLLKELYPDSPQIIDTLTKIQTRIDRIDKSPLRKQMGDFAEGLKTNSSKAASDLLENPDITQPAKIRAVYKTIGAEDSAQLQARMIENFLTESGKPNQRIGGRVAKGFTLAERIDSIPETNWRTAFPNNPNIKENLQELSRIAARQQKPSDVGGLPRITYLLERSPLIIGTYSILRGKGVGVLSRAGAEIATILGIERLAANYLANPDAAKLFLKNIEATNPNTGVIRKLVSFVNIPRQTQMANEDKLNNYPDIIYRKK
jgi:uncharacterized protein YukE